MLEKKADAVDDVVFAQFEFDGFRPSVQSHDCDRGFKPACRRQRTLPLSPSSGSFPAPRQEEGEETATRRKNCEFLAFYHAFQVQSDSGGRLAGARYIKNIYSRIRVSPAVGK